MITITIDKPQAASQTVSFDRDRVRIGRDPSNDLMLDGQGCSRHHAEIRSTAGRYLIVDLGSTNGLRFGGQRVPELLLFDGASVAIGELTLTFRLEGADLDRTLAFPLAPAVVSPSLNSAPSGSSEPADPGAAADTDTPPAQPVLPLFLLVPRGKKIENFKIAPGVEYVIGRSPNADVVIDDPKASLEHARLGSRSGRVLVHDLGSSNGTQLRGRSIAEAELAPGETFIIGDTALTLSLTRFDLSEEALRLDQTQAAVRLPLLVPAKTPAGAAGAASSGSVQGARPGRGRYLALGALALIAAVATIVVLVRARATPIGEPAADAAGPEAVQVAVAPVSSRIVVDAVTGSGTIRPLEAANVAAEVGGRVLAVEVGVGSVVAAGAVIARLDETDMRLQIAEARSTVSQEQLEVARSDYQRKQRLFDDGVVNRSVLELSKHGFLSLQSAWDSAQARIRALEEQRAKTRILAPIAGVVVSKGVSAGELVGPGSPVVRIEDQSAVKVGLEVPDRDVVRLRRGMRVAARVDALQGRDFSGEVETVGTAANPVTRSFLVEARIDNSDGSLRSGMVAAVDIEIERRDGLAAPATVLVDPRENRAVVLEVTEGVVRRREVTLGRRIGDDVEILSGIAEGALLVVSGQERLRDGDPVTVRR